MLSSILVSRGNYDIIVGGSSIEEVQAWIATGSVKPLITIGFTSVIRDIPHPERLFRTLPDFSRTVNYIGYRLANVYAEFAGEDMYLRTGLIVTKGLPYSEAAIDVFVTNTLKFYPNINREDFIKSHVAQITSVKEMQNALSAFAARKYEITFAAEGFYDQLNHGFDEDFEASNDSERTTILIPEKGFLLRLPTVYVNPPSREEFDILFTSYDVEGPEVTDTASLYVPPSDWITLLYVQTMKKLMTVRELSQLPDVFAMKIFNTPEYGNQGYEVISAGIFITACESEIFGIPNIDGFTYRGNRDDIVDYVQTTTSFRAPYVNPNNFVISAQELSLDDKISFRGIYGQGINVPDKNISKYPNMRIFLNGMIAPTSAVPNIAFSNTFRGTAKRSNNHLKIH